MLPNLLGTALVSPELARSSICFPTLCLLPALYSVDTLDFSCLAFSFCI